MDLLHFHTYIQIISGGKDCFKNLNIVLVAFTFSDSIDQVMAHSHVKLKIRKEKSIENIHYLLSLYYMPSIYFNELYLNIFN